jgi:hypothetical protein
MHATRKVAIFIISIAVIAAAVFLFVTALTAINKITDGNSAPQPLTSLEYSLAVNKEIAFALNLAESHMADGLKVIKGEYPLIDELSNTDNTLLMIDEAIASIEALTPPNPNQTDTENTLRKMNAMRDSLETYRKYLKDEDMGGLAAIIEVLEGDFIALKSSFNNNWS